MFTVIILGKQRFIRVFVDVKFPAFTSRASVKGMATASPFSRGAGGTFGDARIGLGVCPLDRQ